VCSSDLAYHLDKFQRGSATLIDVWGADHGGYIQRLKAATKAISEGGAELDVKICQIVRLMDKGEPIKMSKRAGTFVTLRDLITRRMSPDLSSMTVTIAVAAAILGFGLLGSITEQWQPVSMQNWALLAGSSVFIMGGYLFSIQVMRVGDVSFIAPFRYTGLLWALLLGWLMFGDWPDNLTMLGAAIVVSTGLFTLFRERALLRS